MARTVSAGKERLLAQAVEQGKMSLADYFEALAQAQGRGAPVRIPDYPVQAPRSAPAPSLEPVTKKLAPEAVKVLPKAGAAAAAEATPGALARMAGAARGVASKAAPLLGKAAPFLRPLSLVGGVPAAIAQTLLTPSELSQTEDDLQRELEAEQRNVFRGGALDVEIGEPVIETPYRPSYAVEVGTPHFGVEIGEPEISKESSLDLAMAALKRRMDEDLKERGSF